MRNASGDLTAASAPVPEQPPVASAGGGGVWTGKTSLKDAAKEWWRKRKKPALLAGSATCTVRTSGELATEIDLSGAARAGVTAAGDLTTEIGLSGVATCSCSARGTLSDSAVYFDDDELVALMMRAAYEYMAEDLVEA